MPPKKTEKPLKIIREKTAYKKRAKAELWNTFFRYEVKVSDLKKEPWFEWQNYRFLEVLVTKGHLSGEKRMWIDFLRNGNNEKLDGYRKGTDIVRVGCDRGAGINRSVFIDKYTYEFSFYPKEDDTTFYHDKDPRSAHLRDLISLKYDRERDVLLLRTKTPLFDEDGESPTYELRPRKESLVKEIVRPDDGRTY